MSEVKRLIQLLRSKDDKVRLSAAQALGGIGEPAVESLILSLYDAGETVFQRISGVLDMIDRNWAEKGSSRKYLQGFAEAFKKGDIPIKLYIIGILERIGDPGVSQILRTALAAEDTDVRMRAAKALQNIKTIM